MLRFFHLFAQVKIKLRSLFPNLPLNNNNIGSVYHTFTTVPVLGKDNVETFWSKHKVNGEIVKPPNLGISRLCYLQG